MLRPLPKPCICILYVRIYRNFHGSLISRIADFFGFRVNKCSPNLDFGGLYRLWVFQNKETSLNGTEI